MLASASPRRQELLTQLGFDCRTLVTDIDEALQPNESARTYVTRLAVQKAAAGWAKLDSERPLKDNDNRLVIGADTCISLDDEIIGKPKDGEDACSMLSRLAGRTHLVCSAVAISDIIEYTLLQEDKVQDLLEFPDNSGLLAMVRVSQSRVTFRSMSDAEINAYVQTGEPADKAGAYAIQGVAAAFIERLEGSYSGVMGLPLFETATLLRRHGVAVAQVN